MRSDNLLSLLGNCSTGPQNRLWVEDSYSRLTGNGFEIGTAFSVEPRMGPGLNIRPALMGSCHVSQRRGAAILSYEGGDQMARFQTPSVRVKISHGLVQILPSLRAFAVRSTSTEVWSITGNRLVTGTGETILRDGLERPAGRPALIAAQLNAGNLVAATALIAWAKPGTVRLLPGTDTPALPVGQFDLFGNASPVIQTESEVDASITSEVARQFLVACGWSESEPGFFQR